MIDYIDVNQQGIPGIHPGICQGSPEKDNQWDI